MLTYVVRRLLGVIPVILLVTLLVFTLNANIPGDPGRIRLGQQADPVMVEAYNRERGYLDPFFTQYVRYLKNAALLDFGESDVKSGTPVRSIILGAFSVTFRLAVFGTLIASVIGVVAGVISAVKSRTWLDYAAMLFAVVGVSMPVFWLGIMMVIFVAPTLASMFGGRALTGIQGDGFFAQLPSYILPSLTLGLVFSATIARLTRSAMLDVLTQDFIRTARSKGLGSWAVVVRHALRNASIPIVTVIGNSFAYLLVGAVLTESVFSLPGLGREVVTAIQQRDRFVITGGILFMALVFVLVNLLVDLLYAVLDPRIRLGRG
ncbi:MAG: ABC transporter permease [Planctomycetota bacterium]